MINRQTTLTGNVVAFCRYLRNYDFFIGPNEERDSLLSLDILQPYEDPNWFRLCLQTTLCKTQKQLDIFPDLYHDYWKELDRALDSKVQEKEDKAKQNIREKADQQAPGIQAIKNWLYGNKNEELVETASYSDMEVFGSSGFSGFEEKELKTIFQLVQKLVKKIANRRSRRFSTTHKKMQIDLKRSIRKNILRNGELIEILYKSKKRQQIKVVLICDVSKSMELYSRFLIQFMYAFQNLFPRISTFAFSTSLHYISEELNNYSIDRSLEEVLNKVNNWSGGTRIGSSLKTFNDTFAHKHLSGKTLVMILSDGWDTGETELLKGEMKKIHRKALKVLWLNPLAGSSNWQPEVVGMKTVKPYIDALLPFHNVDTLREVVKGLKF